MKYLLTRQSASRVTPHRGLPKWQDGLSLVEIMIALTLGLVILLAVGSVYLGSRQTYRVQEDNARIQEAGKYALEVIGRSIRQAGADTEMNFNPVAITLNCVPPACVAIDSNGAAGATDTIRNQFYAGREELNGAVWSARNCIGGFVAAGALPANIVTNIFDVAADAASTATGTGLRCSDAAGNSQTLVSNIEDLQVIYGIDTTGDQAADQYVATPGNWTQVVTARICVLIQSANNGLATTPQTYLNCEGALGRPTAGAPTTTAGAGDLRLHRSFVATYNLRNRVNGAP
jgi:type IV pilus assembly protein PilW